MLAGAALPPRLAAQETIASDRPGIGSGSFVLAPGIVQLESGIELAHADASGQLTYSIGQAFLRIGVRGFEIEAATSYVMTRDSPPLLSDENGLSDITLGVKVRVMQSAGGRANLSLQGLLTTPTGADAFTADDWVPTLNALLDLSLADRVAMAVNVGYQLNPGATEEVLTLIVTPGYSVTDRFGVFGGIANAFDGAPDGHVHIAEGGATYLVSSDVQIDVNGGIDIDRSDWFLGAGVAIRWGAG